MLQELPLTDLHLSDTQAQCLRRETFDPKLLDELAHSIKRHGVLQPIVVRKFNHKHVIVAGERRYLAAQKAELSKIPAVVREMSDEEVIQVQLIENLQRADLDPLQEAEGYKELIDNYGHPIEAVHARVGKSRAYVYKRLQLLQLSKKCRMALIKNDINVGLALLIARIPNQKLQDEALDDFTGWDGERPTLEAAARTIHDLFMLSLKDAPFPTDDPDLVRSAPACGSCPKRTGNQAELFDDIKATDMCTDPECFAAKKTNHNKRLAKQWKAEGRPVIEGKAAKKVMPFGRFSSLQGYERLDSNSYAGGKSRKVKSLVKEDLDKVALLITPTDGDAVEVIPSAIVRKAERALNNAGKKTKAGEDPAKALDRRIKEENAFRLELYREVRKELLARDDTAFLPSLEEVAIMATERLWHDYRKLLCKLHGLEPMKRTQYGSTSLDYDKPLAKRIKESGEDPRLAMLDALIAHELKTSSGDRQSLTRLRKLANDVGVDPKAVKRRLKAEATAKEKAKRAFAKAKAAPRKKKKAAAKKSSTATRKVPGKRKKDLDPFVHGSTGAE